MKKLYSVCLLIVAITSCFAQITFTQANVPTINWSQKVVKDTLPLPSINYGIKGANRVYNFSNLTSFKNDTINYLAPTAAQLSNVPNAQLAITLDGLNFLFTKTTATKQTLEGFEGLLFGSTLSAKYNAPVPDIYQFSTQYLGKFNGTSTLVKVVSGASVNQPLADSVRLTVTTVYFDTIDGWGKVTTPVGSYKCLRQFRKEFVRTVADYKASFTFGAWTNASDTRDTTVRYSYLTKETKGSVVSFDYDSLDNLRSVTYSQIPPAAPVAKFGTINGANGLVTFTDSTDGYPDTYSWNFGDGSATSSALNPTHVYTSNGPFSVCLTVTNAGGSNTFCKTVTISGLAVTPVAAFSWSNTSGGLVNFTDQSTNMPTSWAWTFGDAQISNSQSPNHVYAANVTYNVCLTATNAAGSNTRCQNILVTNVSAANSAPVAINDSASVLQPNGTVINVGTNDVDPNGNNICVTLVYGSPAFADAGISNCTSIRYTPDSTFTGADTCWYILCDNGTPVLCDTGMLVINSIVNNALLPVAGFDTLSFYACQNITYGNTSANADSVSWVFTTDTNFITLSFTNFNNDSVFIENALVLKTLFGFPYKLCVVAYNQFGSDTFCIEGNDSC